MRAMEQNNTETVARALDRFAIELPSWGFANTGTRFGKFLQPAAAATLEEKFADAGTGARADRRLPDGGPARAVGPARRRRRTSAGARRWRQRRHARRRDQPEPLSGSGLQDGSFGNPDPAVRAAGARALSSRASRSPGALRSRDVSLWFADGSNYPGTANIRAAQALVREGAAARCTRRSRPTQRLLVEYKPFEPAFYHTDIADWGMALLLAREAGPQASVLVDTGHHYQAQNIEQIVAWLLDEEHARRLPFQRPPVCRRRPDARVDRSVPGVPHLSRDPRSSNGRPARPPTSRTWSTRATT